MSPEPLESQILKQILGDERGASVFALNVMAGELARLSQVAQQQAAQLEQLQQATPEPPSGDAGAASGTGNPWTGPAEEEAAP